VIACLSRGPESIELIPWDRQTQAGSDAPPVELVVCDPSVFGDDGSPAPDAAGGVVRDGSVIVILSLDTAGLASGFIERGAADCLILGDDDVELGANLAKAAALVRARRREQRAAAELAVSLARLRARSQALEESVAMLETMVMTDPLTRLANRRQVEQRLPQMFAEAVRYGSDLACMMIDLDGFKAINDTLGHARGDDLLRMTGRLIAEHVRQADLAARYGGDEFLIVMPRSDSDMAGQAAVRLTSVFQRQAALSARGGVRAGMSIGVACLSISKPLDSADLLAHADNALYAAKQAGKCRTMLCGPDGVNAVAVSAAA
jgi:diguanylate cyclase (GGDEF)-like protein